MKKTTKINWKKAILLLENGEKVSQDGISFGKKPIKWDFVQKLNDYKILVPENLIDYDDETIDYSDIPPLEKLLAEGTYKEVFTIKLEQDIANWLKDVKFDYNVLINDFLKSVYKTVHYKHQVV